MLWLALRFPSLPLEIFERGAAAPVSLAVAAGPGAHAAVVICNRRAQARGIRAGMPVAAASALDAGLRILERDTAAESAALERIAARSVEFTSRVSLAPPAEILLEIAGSLNLFGGLTRLWQRIERELDACGFAVSIACAPTPLAAQFFARAGMPARIRHRDALLAGLRELPIDVLDPAEQAGALLHAIGAPTIGACLDLPRAGLARRLGAQFVDRLDRAVGRLPDPRPGFIPPASFRAKLQLPVPVAEAGALLFAARRLLAELAGVLSATGKGVQRLAFSLAHEDRCDTRCELDLVRATRDSGHLTALLRERLERLVLPAPAVAITLESGLPLPLASHNLALLPDAREHAETAARLIERVRARLGEAAVTGLDAVADHRPECAWRGAPPGTEPASGHPVLPRPLWLLPAPRALREIAAIPQHEGPLTLLAGPERIESGWWDGNDVGRDYFVARSPAAALLWIYRERRVDGGWYLHGFFG